MSTTEQNLCQAKERFESAAGCRIPEDGIGLLGEGLALLTSALIDMNLDIERLKTLASKKPK